VDIHVHAYSGFRGFRYLGGLLLVMWYGLQNDSRKGRFAQTHKTIHAGWFAHQGMIRAIIKLWIFRASKLLCCVSFKLRF